MKDRVRSEGKNFKRVFVFITSCLSIHHFAISQNTKTVTQAEQIWLGYFNQTRFSNKLELWTDLHLRTKDNFTTDISQAAGRIGITYVINEAFKATAGFAYFNHFPAEGNKLVSRPELRPWQQLQLNIRFTNTSLTQRIRLEERYRRRVLNDSTLAHNYNFNFRIRYYLLYEVPFSRSRTNKLSFIINDEIHVNFGKEIIYNYFDQNRLFLGIKLNTGKSENVQVGYMNLFQQQTTGNSFRNNHVIRIFYYQNLDLRKRIK